MVRKLLQVLTALIVGALTVTTMSFACLFGVTIYETFFKIPDEITVPNAIHSPSNSFIGSKTPKI